ncbi:MAG TPA: trypsin-like peptidase domain-containing protein [Isosphaeraceae bacterium]|nr:trypsin-like peptidase domain-containing protein [Isosphaeraceae bacterium]
MIRQGLPGTRDKGELMTWLFLLACISLFELEPPVGAQSVNPNPPPAQPPAPMDVVAALETVVADAIARAEPSVVAINRVKGENPQETLAVRGKSRPPAFDPRVPRSRFSRDGELGDQISLDFGSGVVVGTEGQILTAYHVVKGASRLDVRAAERQQFEAEIIAADPRIDLAVIVPVAIPGMPMPKLRPIRLGDSASLRKGSFLVALGNPFNAAQDGKPSASWGILSNLARKVSPEYDEMAFSRRLSFPNYPTLLQLDSKLNLGMSGGAVINMKGELVGLTTMASSPAGFDAMAGYAMPMDRLGRRAVETLKEGKEIEYGLLGIRAHPASTNRVEGVTPGSPADQGQLQADDEILAVNDIPVSDFDTLILAINSYAPGDEVRLKIRRAGKELTKTVNLAKYPVDGDMIATNRPPAWRGIRVDYLTTVSARGAGPPFPEPLPRGVVVSEVLDDSLASRSGLKKFQIIREVEKTPVSNPSQFAQAVAGLKGPVTLLTDQGPVTLSE